LSLPRLFAADDGAARRFIEFVAAKIQPVIHGGLICARRLFVSDTRGFRKAGHRRQFAMTLKDFFDHAMRRRFLHRSAH
jgi:hypothetical protein